MQNVTRIGTTALEQRHTIAIGRTHLDTSICNRVGVTLFIPSIAATLFHAGFFFDTFLCHGGTGAGVFSSAGSAISALADNGEVKICKNV